ncbi:hypothetical protein L873DRAFT_180654 [Choiromyces venosus 120613-1]|uniref:Uncharacterized protein n=1 Tax=Choiromyces venosus 120613-1 TaxID=1336337 RepID=A0A3N4K350_9PEZI|nr:hypothetical protein L873DRAFT_180654 [Choiromyces venosus 120613-1]
MNLKPTPSCSIILSTFILTPKPALQKTIPITQQDHLPSFITMKAQERMTFQHNQTRNVYPVTQQGQPLTADPERAKYLQKLHAQGVIIHHELSKRLIFLEDYVDHALSLVDSNLNLPDYAATNVDRVFHPAQTLLDNILDLDRAATVLVNLDLERGREDWEEIHRVARELEGFVGETGWTFLGGDDCNVQVWLTGAEILLQDGERASRWVEEANLRVEVLAGEEGVVITRST